MHQEEFKQLASTGVARIPVMRAIPMAEHTPISIYQGLAKDGYSCLLESATEGGVSWSRYSIIVPYAERCLKVEDGKLSIYRGTTIEKTFTGNVFEDLQSVLDSYKTPRLDNLPPFDGGVLGFFSYDTLAYVEKRLAQAPTRPHPLATPDIALLLADELIAFDRVEQTIKLVVLADCNQSDAYAAAQNTLDRIEQDVHQLIPPPADKVDQERMLAMSRADKASVAENEARCYFDKASYGDIIERIQEYILAGDVMQVVPSRRAELDFAGDAFDFYRVLRCINPSPYMYYFNFGDYYIVGSSPEILGRLRGDVMTTRPIAGTRKRGKDEADDKRMAAELLADPKELAEHLMLIDLGRNDLGRLATIGSVKLIENMAVERYSHVMHIVSTVQGLLKEGTALDVLLSLLPAGTLSGAPKIRAMEIINELEPVKRGMYGGAVGYIAANGDMDMAVAIRTVVIKDGTLYIQAGGGIVADSSTDLEWKETVNKARVMFRAADLTALLHE